MADFQVKIGTTELCQLIAGAVREKYNIPERTNLLLEWQGATPVGVILTSSEDIKMPRPKLFEE